MEKATQGEGGSAKGFWRCFDTLTDLMAALAGGILVFITAAVCYTIGMRYLFTQTTIWVMQTTEYALLWIVFLATTWLLRQGGHITTDLIYTHLQEKTKCKLDVVMFVIGGLACAVMVFFGIDYTHRCIVKTINDVRAVTVPKWTIFVIIPIGSLLLTVQFFRMAWSRLADIRRMR
jgi:TRAP-type C4-dicarboxylate transport system permease small subunit